MFSFPFFPILYPYIDVFVCRWRACQVSGGDQHACPTREVKVKLEPAPRTPTFQLSSPTPASSSQKPHLIADCIQTYKLSRI